MTDDNFVFQSGEPIPTKQEQDEDDFVFISGDPVATKDDWSQNPVPDVSTLVSKGETALIEFKRDRVQPKKMAKEVAALANFAERADYDAGYLLLGVTDDGTIDGLDNPNETEEWVAQVCASHLGPDIQLTPRVSETVLIVRVSAASEGLFQIDERTPTRTGTTITWIED